MIYPLEQVAQQISKTDQQLLYYLILEQQETNRLLRELIDPKKPAQAAIQTEIKQVDNTINELKRPDLMKRMSKLENKPDGWNKWETEKMREFVKGVTK